ncbi:MAG: N-acetylmuramoyl-L-alanine amidase [Saprospiraceae bacterium]
MRIKNSFLFLLTLCIALCSLELSAQYAQELRANLVANSSKNLDVPAGGLQAFTAEWTADQHPTQLQYRYAKRDKSMSSWMNWSLDNEAGTPAASLLTLPGHVRRIEVKSTSNYNVTVRALTYNDADQSAKTFSALEANVCPCPAPAVVERDSWCPNGDCPTINAPTPLTPEVLIVHHSAGNLTPDVDYALVVRAIYDFHVNTNGWSDIGYNLLIAPDGTVYQGRGTAAQGAHFCAQNAGTLGVCMLGNYVDQAPATAAMSALTTLGYFLSCEFEIDVNSTVAHQPSGLSLDGLSGHRDGCNTACPGEMLYAELPQLRTNIAARIDAGCQALEAPNNLTADALTNGTVGLNWEAYAGASRILIERSSSVPSNYVTVTEISGTLANYSDRTAPSGANYYRIRALIDGELSDYSNEAMLSVSSSEAGPPSIRPRLARNPVRGQIEIKDLVAPVDMAFISDAGGRTVLELNGSTPRWNVQPGQLSRGKYWIMIFSGNEWYTVPFEYMP